MSLFSTIATVAGTLASAVETNPHLAKLEQYLVPLAMAYFTQSGTIAIDGYSATITNAGAVSHFTIAQLLTVAEGVILGNTESITVGATQIVISKIV